MSAADVERLNNLEQVVSVLARNASPEVAAEIAAAIAPTVSDGIAAGIAEGSDAIDEAVADLAVLAIQNAFAFDPTEPLTAAERATWFAKYDSDKRRAMTADHSAMRDGGIAIGDVDDLKCAIRAWQGDESTRQHIVRNAERLDASDLTMGAEITLGKYSADDLRALLKKGQAMPPASPGGLPRYPIADADDADAAVKAVGRGSGDHDAIRVYVMKALKKLGMESKIPENWNSDGSLKS